MQTITDLSAQTKHLAGDEGWNRKRKKSPRNSKIYHFRFFKDGSIFDHFPRPTTDAGK
jgi:hypothetical protein